MKQKTKQLNRVFKYLGIKKEQISNQASFRDDFYFDDFKMGCLIFYLETYFDMEIQEEEIQQIRTIGDVKQYLGVEVEEGSMVV